MKVYPNPTSNLLNIHLNGMKKFDRVTISNMLGQPVRTLEFSNTNRSQINISDLDNGFYVLSVNTIEGIVNQKFQVIKD